METFTRFSHHASLSVIFTTQNIYHKSNFGVTLRRNISEHVIFFAKNDLVGMKTLSEYFYLF